jgi:membrane-associated protease RseP (regulator of RpoE activity)
MLAISIAHSKISAGAVASPLLFGRPLMEGLLEAWLRPGVAHATLLLSPVGRAAWVGLFATALNLLPVGQLDGGHILYAVLGDKCRNISRGFCLMLLPLGYFCWYGWLAWAVILFFLGLRHPMVVEPVESLGRPRKILAVAAALILALTFLPAPFRFQ